MKARHLGGAILFVAVVSTLGASWLAPHSVDEKFPSLLNAPPTTLHVRDDAGTWRAPFIYSWRRVSQLEQRYEEDRAAPVSLTWLDAGRLVRSSDEPRAPLLLLGADSSGRDVFSRLLFGARLSLGLALLAAVGAMMIGAFIGGIAGYVGGVVDEAMMRASDFILVLPAMYVVLALRSMMALVLGAGTVFLLLTAIFAVVGSPFISRGVRTIVRTERGLDYAVAAASLGAGHVRLLVRHLLPAAAGFVVVELTMLVPAFIVAEATLSYVGLGFPDTTASWGTMLQDASSVRTFTDFPWLLSPAAAMFVAVLGLNLLLQGTGNGLQYERPM
jgi:peptide/nickel transport system permease protein